MGAIAKNRSISAAASLFEQAAADMLKFPKLISLFNKRRKELF